MSQLRAWKTKNKKGNTFLQKPPELERGVGEQMKSSGGRDAGRRTRKINKQLKLTGS